MNYGYYKYLLEKRRAWYKTIGKTYCKLLKCDVFFTSKGFYHLQYNGSGKKRNKKEILRRLLLLPLSVSVINNSKHVSKYTSKMNKFGKFIQFWKLEMKIVFGTKTVVVILKKIGGSKIIFYSIWDK